MTKYHLKIKYPVLVIEEPGSELTGMNNVRFKSDFHTSSRVPKIGKFKAGCLFDSAGFCYRYNGECGKPRFPVGWVSVLLETLIIPPIITKILERIYYFGPNITSRELLPVEVFKEEIISAVASRKAKDGPELRRALSREVTYDGVLKAVDHWRYYGGKRDKDGHLLEDD